MGLYFKIMAKTAAIQLTRRLAKILQPMKAAQDKSLYPTIVLFYENIFAIIEKRKKRKLPWDLLDHYLKVLMFRMTSFLKGRGKPKVTLFIDDPPLPALTP